MYASSVSDNDDDDDDDFSNFVKFQNRLQSLKLSIEIYYTIIRVTVPKFIKFAFTYIREKGILLNGGLSAYFEMLEVFWFLILKDC